MLTGPEFDLGSPLPVESAETVEGAKILEKSNSSCRIANCIIVIVYHQVLRPALMFVPGFSFLQ